MTPEHSQQKLRREKFHRLWRSGKIWISAMEDQHPFDIALGKPLLFRQVNVTGRRPVGGYDARPPVVIQGADFAQQMETMLDKDRAAAEPIDAEQWQQRSLWLRMQEWMAQRFEYWL